MGALERIDLKAIVKKYGCINFIETGTGWGNGLAIASSLPFMNIYSIEIAPARARAVSDRFLDDTRINVMTSSSVVGLRKIFDECSTETPFLFWLDAHFPDYAGDGDDWNRELNESIRLPLEEELFCILTHRRGCHDVIIIDDMRLYENGSYQKGKAPSEINLPNPAGVRSCINTFRQTHEIIRDNRDTGYLLMFPIRN